MLPSCGGKWLCSGDYCFVEVVGGVVVAVVAISGGGSVVVAVVAL